MPVDSAKRLEMLGAALDLLDEGVAVLDPQSTVIYWNDAAASLTGHRRMNLLSRPCPVDFYQPHDHGSTCGCNEQKSAAVPRYTGPAYSGQIYLQKSLSDVVPQTADSGKAVLVDIRHHLGHKLPAMLRKVPMRDHNGDRLGTVLLFHAVADVDTLSHAVNSEAPGRGRTQSELESHLDEAFDDWKSNNAPFGLLWIVVDQASQMRRTHGRDACEAMLGIVEHRLAQGLRQSEIIGRWGTDEFLVLSHERTSEALLEHGNHLASLARTAEFRWWGDRVSLTASIGTAQAEEGDTLARLMLEAQQAMHASVYAGGNRVTHGRELTCSR